MITSAISPRTLKFKKISPVGASRSIGEISLSRGFLFFHSFGDFVHPETTVEPILTRFYSDHINSGLLHFKRIKMQKVSVSPILPPLIKTLKGDMNRRFQVKHKIFTALYYRNFCSNSNTHIVIGTATGCQHLPQADAIRPTRAVKRYQNYKNKYYMNPDIIRPRTYI